MGGTRHFNVIIFPERLLWPYSILEYSYYGASIDNTVFFVRITLPVMRKKFNEMVKKA